MSKLTFVVFLVLVVFIPVSGQKIVPTPGDLYVDALEYMFAGDYNEALPVLLNLQERGFSTANISYKIGECYLNIRDQKTKAIPYLMEAVHKVSGTYTGNSLEEEDAPYKALLYLGIAYRLNYDFDNALVYFNAYLNTLDDVDKENIRLTEYHIERCNNARELMASPATFVTDTLINLGGSSVSNFNPLVTADEKVLYYMDRLKFYDAVMHADKVEVDWQVPVNITPDIKSDGDHYVTGMSTDGMQLLLTAYDPYRSGEIFTTEFSNGHWNEMVKLNDSINTIFNETHASFSPDGQYLYFTSDRKGGYGGLDIYRSSKTAKGNWGSVVNLGPLINSPYNEESPFVSPDAKKLFFSSQGHYNMGGYDVFCSSLGDDNIWLPPVNIGYPLNSTDDDLFFFPLDTGNVAYQSRSSSFATRAEIVRYDIKSYGNPARYMVNGKINLHADSGYDPGNISVAFINRKANDTLAIKQLQDDGSFRQKLPGGAYKLDFSDGARSLLSRDLDIPNYFPHNNLVINEDITIPAGNVTDTIQIADIRFAFDRSTLEERYLTYLEEIVGIMAKYPGLTVQVNGYTDALGSEKYNLKLSLVRANSVADYLKNKISQPERISVKGYGEENPVAVNTKLDGSDNPSGRSYNRRVALVFVNVPGDIVIIKHTDIPETLLQK